MRRDTRTTCPSKCKPTRRFANSPISPCGGYGDRPLAGRATALAGAVEAAIAKYGVVYDFNCGGAVYAYEVDGLGGRVFFDDANIPSLLAAPLVSNLSIDDARLRALAGERVLLPETRDGRRRQPTYAARLRLALAMIARALTSADRREVASQSLGLAASAGSDGLIHESFDPNDPKSFTRAQFGWANAMYAELLFRTAADFAARAIEPATRGIFRRHVSESIALVDRVTALQNTGMLLRAFERAVPLSVVGPENDD